MTVMCCRRQSGDELWRREPADASRGPVPLRKHLGKARGLLLKECGNWQVTGRNGWLAANSLFTAERRFTNLVML